MGQFHAVRGENGTHPNFGDNGYNMTRRIGQIGMCPYFHVEEYAKYSKLTHYQEKERVDTRAAGRLL